MLSVFTEQKPWLEKYSGKISRSGYFFAAVLLHLVVGLLVATLVIFPGLNPTPDFRPKAFVIHVSTPPPPTPPLTPETPKVDTGALPDLPTTTIHTIDPNASIVLPIPDPSSSTLPAGAKTKLIQPIPRKPVSIDPERRKRIEIFVKSYRDPGNIPDSLDEPSNVKLTKFPVYLASYADGDWGCNVSFNAKGEILAGSLPNLVAKINEWSHGNIPGEVVPQPLNIGGPDLRDKKPPFIFFTGHKDFTLTPQEVANLAEYVQMGGCIWGDNALAGRGSRFDVAFRREMKRVVPDIDQEFKPFPADDKIYTRGKYPLSLPPPGINFYAEDIEHLDIDGKAAIIYTPNDYSDMFAMRILPDNKTIVGGQPVRKSGSPLFTSGVFLYNSGIFFRNFDLQPCLQSDKLGMDIVIYLLTRFDSDLIIAP